MRHQNMAIFYSHRDYFLGKNMISFNSSPFEDTVSSTLNHIQLFNSWFLKIQDTNILMVCPQLLLILELNLKL